MRCTHSACSRPCTSGHGRRNLVSTCAGACKDLLHPDLGDERRYSRCHQRPCVLDQVAEVVPGRFHFAALTTYEGFKRCRQAAYSICYCTDDELVSLQRAGVVGPLQSLWSHP